ncbi:MAG: response regulator [Byssovorax sp.]
MLERLGGARADFVAALGRRVADLHGCVKQLEDDLGSDRLRDDLRRRLHALAAGARLLRFTKLAEELGRCEPLLSLAAERGSAAPSDLTAIRAVLGQAQALAWGDASMRDQTPQPARVAPSVTPRPPAVLDQVRVPLAAPPSEPAPAYPLTVLVVGPPQIADALSQPEGDGAQGRFEVERTGDNTSAIDLARALAPDVILVDIDRPGARELCQALLGDPLTELVPLIALGRWTRPEDAAPFAALGATYTLAKPASPDQIRRACAAAAVRRAGREPAPLPVGEVDLGELSARLADEVRRGLCDAAVASGKGARFDLGEGNEVLAAVWGAVARIRDLVTIRSSGNVRFAPSGPEGALPVASWMDEPRPAGEQRGQRALDPRARAEVSLERKSIVVADDDPAVTWFLAGVLRAAGAVVHEARDGARALDLAFRHAPDLVISDVLMPELDGFGLCRALKRDVVLRDVPVILLSWKEDLLQRVRELGADADGYLRKEQSAASIVQRVREVLRGKRRVAERIAARGETRGRLDGLTARTLLQLTSEERPDALVSIRDALFLYEIELREGRPARASRTAADGTFDRGAPVLGALLGVGTGRFVVSALPEPSLPAELDGPLDLQLRPFIASARAAQRLLSGAALSSVERVEISESRMVGYAAATPEPARTLLRTLGAGTSPRALISSGQAAPRLVEDVLCDAAAHGAITEIIGPDGEELLDAATEHEIDILEGQAPPPAPLPEPVLDLGPIIHTSTPAPVALYTPAPVPVIAPTPVVAPAAPVSAPAAPVSAPAPAPIAQEIAKPVAQEIAPAKQPEPARAEPVAIVPAARPAIRTEAQNAPFALSPSALPATAMLERPAPVLVPPRSPVHPSLHTPAPPLTRTPTPKAAPVAPVAPKPPVPPVPPARPASVAPPPPPVAASPRPAAWPPAPPPPPPTAIVAAVTQPSEEPRPVAPKPLVSLGSLTPPPVLPAPPKPARLAAPTAPIIITANDETPSRTVRKPSSYVAIEPREKEAPKKEGAKDARTMWALFAVAGVVFAVGARLSRDRQDAAPPPAPAPVEVTAATVAATAAPAPEPAPAPPPEEPKAEGESKNNPILPVETALRPDDKVPPGQGMLEVTAGTSDSIYIDGTLVGNGPLVKRALAPRKEPYEIRVRLRGEERVRFALVKEARLTKLRVSPPWSR